MVHDDKRDTLRDDIAILKDWIDELEHGVGSHRKLTPTGKLAIADLKAKLHVKEDQLRRSHQATMPKRSKPERPRRFFID